MNTLFLILIVLATAGSGTMCGLFFSFSNFVMKALFKLPPNHGSAAMQSVNITIINPWFLSLFLGTAISSLALAVFAIAAWAKPGASWTLAGSVLYLIGCMVVTMCCNVPLNNELAAIDPDDPDSAMKWQEYYARWMPWNHVRTIATLGSTTAFILGLIHLQY